MERKEVKAFRQRLKYQGYTDIHIYDTKQDSYFVFCVSPDGHKVQMEISLRVMNAIRGFHF